MPCRRTLTDLGVPPGVPRGHPQGFPGGPRGVRAGVLPGVSPGAPPGRPQGRPRGSSDRPPARWPRFNLGAATKCDTAKSGNLAHTADSSETWHRYISGTSAARQRHVSGSSAAHQRLAFYEESGVATGAVGVSFI